MLPAATGPALNNGSHRLRCIALSLLRSGCRSNATHQHMKTNTPDSGPEGESDPWLNTEAACKYLSVQKLSIYRWVKAKLLTPKRTPGGELRFRRSDLDDLLS